MKAGETIENPFSGERITFLEVPGEANGDLLRFDWRFPPGFAIPEHAHVRQEERHEVLSGTLRGRISGQARDYGPGDRVIGPAGVTHAWRDPSDEAELRIISELQPARDFGELLETAFSILGDLKPDRPGALIVSRRPDNVMNRRHGPGRPHRKQNLDLQDQGERCSLQRSAFNDQPKANG